MWRPPAQLVMLQKYVLLRDAALQLGTWRHLSGSCQDKQMIPQALKPHQIITKLLIVTFPDSKTTTSAVGLGQYSITAEQSIN